jgi:hypothetical protein
MPQTTPTVSATKRKYYKPVQSVLDLPNLTEIQTKSRRFLMK